MSTRFTRRRGALAARMKARRCAAAISTAAISDLTATSLSPSTWANKKQLLNTRSPCARRPFSFQVISFSLAGRWRRRYRTSRCRHWRRRRRRSECRGRVRRRVLRSRSEGRLERRLAVHHVDCGYSLCANLGNNDPAVGAMSKPSGSARPSAITVSLPLSRSTREMRPPVLSPT